MISPSGRSATFSDAADGYAKSEGAVALVLKTKSAALRDGNRTLGVVRSSGVMHNGRSQGLVAPNVDAQIALQRMLIEKAGCEASDIE